MNIIIFHFPYSSVFGGIERQTIDLFTELKKRGHQVTFGGQKGEVLFNKMKSHKFRTISVLSPKMASTLWSGIWTTICGPFSVINFYLKLRKAKISGEKNIAFFISLNEKILATIPALLLGYKVFWVEHVQIGKWFLKHPFRPIYVLLSQHTTVITVSPRSAQTLEKIGVKNIQVILNGVDSDRFYQGVKKIDLQEKITVGANGRLNGQLLPEDLFQTNHPLPAQFHDKGIDILIRSLSRIKAGHLRVNGLIASDGPNQSKFENLAKRMNSPVEFLGYLESKKYANFVKSCDIFIVPSSNTDSFSLAAAEALTAGLPTIISNFTGISDLVRGGAYIVHGRDPQAISSAISEILDDPSQAKEIAIKGQKIALQKFGLQSMVNQYEALFSS